MEDADATQRSDDSDTEFPHAVGFAISAILLTVAFVGATTAGVLDSVGPYLLGVSALVGILFLLGQR